MIDLSKKKVIIADVDGTICESCQQITEEMAQEINQLIKKGYTFAFISGTGLESLKRMVSSGVKEEHYLLATTGTNCTKVRKEEIETLYNHSLPKKDKDKIVAAFEKLVNCYNIKSWTTKEDQIQDRDSQITLSAIGRHAPTEEKAKYDPDGKKRLEWVEFLRKELNEEEYEIKVAGTTSIDITLKGMDKEKGIRNIATHLGVPFSQILFFGDKIFPGGNDYPATKVVDCISVEKPEDTLKKLKEMRA